MSANKFRTIGLALVTLLGSVHLSTTATAAPVQDACDSNAAGFAEGFCSAMGHDDWGSVTYTCEGGKAKVSSVTCVDEA
jgi:hypothetical protein